VLLNCLCTVINNNYQPLQDTTIVLETARLYHPDLYRQLKQQSDALDRLGRAGCNLYSCHNYTAAQHSDDDAIPSFCTQLELTSYQEWKEYSFVQAEYGLYFETRGNMLWYVLFVWFHGNRLNNILKVI
jgi:hypothetical protein